MTRVIPPVLFMLLLLPLLALWLFHPETLIIRRNRALPWDVPLPIGLALLIWARPHFNNQNAEIHTFKKAKALVTNGPFRFSRNPMYLGFMLILLATAMFVNTWCALLVPLTFLGASILWYIPHEEQQLRQSFGTDYDAYAWNTRRWI